MGGLRMGVNPSSLRILLPPPVRPPPARCGFLPYGFSVAPVRTNLCSSYPFEVVYIREFDSRIDR